MATGIHWLGGNQDDQKIESYSRVSTCLALSQAVYSATADDCVSWLTSVKDSLYHGIQELMYYAGCDRCCPPYLIAFKPTTNEIYIAFRGTTSWRELFTSFNVWALPDQVQGQCEVVNLKINFFLESHIFGCAYYQCSMQFTFLFFFRYTPFWLFETSAANIASTIFLFTAEV
jgi:hypothetical protein